MHYSVQSIGHFVEMLGEELAERTAFTYFAGYRRRSYSYADLRELARKLATHLVELGLDKGDRVLICAENCPEWATLLLACGLTGVTLVPVDRKSSASLLDRIAGATDPRLLVTDRADLAERSPIPALDIDELFPLSAGCDPRVLDERDVYVDGDDVLEIVFTSGTTTEPKGAVIRQRNVVANLRALRLSLRFDPAWRFLSLLPLSHMLEQTVGCLAPLRFGCQVIYHKRVPFAEVAAIIREQRVTTIVAVPAVLELFKSKIEDRAAEIGSADGLRRMVRVGGRLPFGARRLLSRPVRKGLGPALTAFICGGGPLGDSVEGFWERLGIRVIQGYGLTEASPIVTCNSFEERVRGSVGRVLREQRLRLEPDGEILVAGENVIGGYHQRPDLDAGCFCDGWYRTGDIGRLDGAGNLYIVGRKKNMIVGANGMNVYPEDIEGALVERPEVAEAVVFADEVGGRAELVAAVIPRGAVADVDALREQVNADLEPHQRLARLVVWHRDEFPRTPTLKVKREEVVREYGELAGARNDRPTGPSARDRLCELVARVAGRAPSEVDGATRLAADLGLDSLAMVELAVSLEAAYGTQIDEGRLAACATVAEVADLLERRESAAPLEGARDWPRSLSARIARAVLLPLFQLLVLRLVLGLRVQVDRRSRARSRRPVIYVANHQSHLDTPTVLGAIARTRGGRVAVAAAHDHFFANRRLVGFLGQLVLGMFPFHREGGFRANLKSIGRCLDAGWSVLIFPEGTRSRSGAMARFKPGIGRIVREMGVPVVPLRIDGAHELLPAGRTLPRRGTVCVTVGDELEIAGQEPEEITSTLERAVARMGAAPIGATCAEQGA